MILAAFCSPVSLRTDSRPSIVYTKLSLLLPVLKFPIDLFPLPRLVIDTRSRQTVVWLASERSMGRRSQHVVTAAVAVKGER